VSGCTGPGQDALLQIIDVLGPPKLSYPIDGTHQETIRAAAMPPGTVLRFVSWLDPEDPTDWSLDVGLYDAPAPACPEPTALPSD
jgi:hypothetical protein